MSVNKVIYGNRTLIDLTGDTVTEKTLLKGCKAHGQMVELLSELCYPAVRQSSFWKRIFRTHPEGMYRIKPEMQLRVKSSI